MFRNTRSLGFFCCCVLRCSENTGKIPHGLTDTAQPRYGNTDEELAEMAKAMPLGRMGRPEEIAGMMTYLASAPAAWITGQVYHINGGVYLA